MRVRLILVGSTNRRWMKSCFRTWWHTKLRPRVTVSVSSIKAGITDVDQWFSNYAATDQHYLLHFYRTGDKSEFKDFWQENAPLLQGKPIPKFEPRKRTFRMDGVVI